MKYSQSMSMAKDALMQTIKRAQSVPDGGTSQNLIDDSNLNLAANAPDTLIPIGTIICNLMKNCSYLLCVTAITVLMFV